MGLENGSKNKTKNARLKITNEISIILSSKFITTNFERKRTKKHNCTKLFLLGGVGVDI